MSILSSAKICQDDIREIIHAGQKGMIAIGTDQGFTIAKVTDDNRLNEISSHSP